MKNHYYFLISSLPNLVLPGITPLKKEVFLDVCKQHLKKSDFTLLKSVKLFCTEQKVTRSSVLTRFYNFEYGLREALAKLRSRKYKIMQSEFVRNGISDNFCLPLAEEAFNADSPLTAEEILNKARWKFLDKLEFGHYFDLERLVIFFIRLQILERITLFNVQKGNEKLNAVLDLKQAQNRYFQTLSNETSDRNISL